MRCIRSDTSRVLVRLSCLTLVLALSGAPAVSATEVVTVSTSAGFTTRVSVKTGGAQGDGNCLVYLGPSISGDGRYVAFESEDDNLVSGDTNRWVDVFVHDRVTRTTTRVSVHSGGVQMEYGGRHPSISADGRYVAFTGEQVFVHDLHTGITTCASVSSGGVWGNAGGGSPSISADGRYVAFESSSSNLVPGDDPAKLDTDIFVHDFQTGLTTCVSVSTAGVAANSYSELARISGDGRYVAFMSEASNLVAGDTNHLMDVFVHDRQTGVTTRESVSSSGAQGNGPSIFPSISADGRFVTYASTADNLVVRDTNQESDVFVRDRQSASTELVSVPWDGVQARGGSGAPSISADGRYVAFTAWATDLIPNDPGVYPGIFVRDRQAASTKIVSVAPDGTRGQGDSSMPSISAAGRHVAFISEAADLVPDDTNGGHDVFVRFEFPSTQIAGPDRYATAAAASRDAYHRSASTVVIATGENWPDALGGSALAGAVDGPLLLVRRTSIPDVTLEEMWRLGATKVYVLGGSGAIEDGVVSVLRERLGAANVIQLEGPTRYETAEKVAAEVIRLKGASFGGRAFVARGDNYPDALAASPLAAAWKAPIILARPGTVAPALPAQVTRVTILGETDVVSAAIESALKASLGQGNVSRLGGATRYETAALVAASGVAGGLMWDGVGITTGENFPDALAGGVLQGKVGSVMLLTRTSTLSPGTAAALTANKAAIDSVTFYGSTVAVGPAVRTAVAQLLE